MSKRTIDSENIFDDWDETPIIDLPSTQSKSTDLKSTDLKSQLFDLQKQLNLGDIRPKRAAKNEDLEIVLPPIISSSKNLKTSNKIDNSVDFLGDLSDNLLMKSRKLNYENQKLLKEVADLKKSNDLFTKQISNLTILNKKLSDNEEEQNSNIWKLESELQEINSKFEFLQLENSKLNNLKDNVEQKFKDLQIIVDQLESEKKISTESNNSIITKLTIKLNEAKESNDSLSNENDVLVKTIDDLKFQIEKLTFENNSLSNKISSHSNDESFSEFDDSILVDPIPLTTLNNELSNYDNDLLKKNLELAYKKLHKLLSQNSKLKNKLNKIESPNKKNILDPIFDENKNVVDDNSWGAFNDDSFTNKAKIVTEPDIILNSDDDLNFSEIEKFDGSSSLNSRRNSLTTAISSKPSFMMILPKTTLDANPNIDVIKFDFSKFQTIPVPHTIADKLIENSNKINNMNFMSNFDLVSKDLVENLNDQVAKMNDILDNPNIDYLKTKAKELDLVVTEKSTFDDKIEMLNKLTDQFNELKQKYDNLDVQYATSKLVNFEIISKSEYTDLITNIKDLKSSLFEKDDMIIDLNNLNKELSSRLSDESKSLKTVEDELKSIKNAYENPDLDYVKAKLVDYVVLHKEDLDNLMQKAENLELDLASKFELINQLQQSITTPSIEYLTEKAQSFNYKVIALSDYNELHEKISQLEEKVQNPSVKFIQEKAKTLGYVVIETKYFEELQDTTKNPSPKFIESNVEKLGKVLVSANVLKELESIQGKYDAPSLEYLKSKSESHKSIVIPTHEHNDLVKTLELLQSEIESPTIDYIKTKANNLKFIVFPETEYTDLVDSNQQLLKKYTQNEELLAEKTRLLIDTQTRLEKSDTANRDALASINGLQEKISLSALNLADLTAKVESFKEQNISLKKQLDTPSIEYLNEKSTMLNHVIVPESEHFDLKSKITVLAAKINDKDEHIDSLSESQLKIEQKNQELKSKLEVLEFEYNDVQSKLQKLQSFYESPQLEYLKEKASDLNAKVIFLKEFNELSEQNSAKEIIINDLNKRIIINEESISRLEAELSQRGNILELLESDLRQVRTKNIDLVTKIDSPDSEYIVSKATEHKLIAIPMAEHDLWKEELKQKDLELSKYREVQLELVSKNAEIEQLLHEKKELSAQLESQRSTVRDLENQIKSLEESFELPSADFIKSKSKAHGLVVISLEEHNSINEQLTKTTMELASVERELHSLQRTKKDLELQGINSVSIELHDSVQKELHQTKSELDVCKQNLTKKSDELKQHSKKVEELKSIEEKLHVKEKEFADLRTKYEELVIKSAKNDELLYEFDLKHTELETRFALKEELQNQVDLLVVRENELKESLANMEKSNFELLQVKSVYDKPDFKYLEAKCKELGYVPITIEEKAENNSSLNYIKELEENIKRLESEVVTLSTQNNEIAELKNKLQKDVIKMQELKQQVNCPTIDYLKSKSSIHNLVVISTSQHSELNDTIADLGSKLDLLKSSLETTKAEKLELQQKVVDLEAKHASPSVDYISSKLPSLGYIPVPIIEHNSTKSDMQRKEILLKQKEKQLKELFDMKTINEEKINEINNELKSLKSLYENPTIDYMKEKLHLFAMIPVLELEYNQLNVSHLNAIQKLEEKGKELEMVKAEQEKFHREIMDKTAEWEKKESNFVSHISELETENEQLRIKVVQLETELEHNSSIIKESTIQIESLNMKLMNLEKDGESNRKDITDLRNEHELKVSEVAILSGEFNELKLENNTLKAKVVETEKLATIVSASEGYQEELRLKVSLLKDQLSVVTEKLLLSEQKNESSQQDYEMHIENLNVENSRLNETIETLRKELSIKTAELSEVVCKLEQTEKLYKQQTLELEQQEADYLERLQNIEADLKSKTIECDAITAQKATEFKVQLEEIKQLQSQANLLQDKISSIELELEEKELQFQATKSELESALVDKQIEVDELRANNSELEQELADAKFENEATNSALEDAKTRLHQSTVSKSTTNFIEPIQNLEMAKSSSNATITNGIFDELNRQPVEALVSVLQQRGYVVVPHEEFNKLILQKRETVVDDLENLTHEMEDIEHNLGEKQRVLDELETLSRSDTNSITSSIHSETIPVEKVLLDKYNSLNNLVTGLGNELSDLISKKDMLKKQLHRLSVASHNDASEKLNHKIYKKIEKLDSEIEVKEVELKFQQSALDAVSAYLTKSKSMVLPPITHILSSTSTDQVLELEKEITELRSEYEHKKDMLDVLQKEIKLSAEPEHLVTTLTSLGYTVTAPSGDQLHLKYIILHGLKFSVNSLTRMEHFDKNSGSCNIDNLIKKKGYSLVPVAEVNRFKTLSNPTISHLKANALKQGYVVVRDTEMKELVERSKALKTPENLTVDELQRLAARHNFEMLPKMEVVKLKQRTITTHDLAKKAESLKLVLLTKEELNSLKANTPVTKSNIIEKGKQFDLLCIPARQFIATTVSKTPDIPNVVVLPNSYYNVLTRSHDWYKKNKTQSRLTTPTQNHRDSPSISPSPSINDHTGVEPFTGKQLLPPPNLNNLPGNFDAVSLYTVDSVISNKKEIIAAITQTMLGTFLYKYYRKLGPLTSISDTRHERFFWVNPYTLSLLWCVSNPGACDPGKANIKAATILDVKSVADNNPLPAGLYYKSLVITSYDKTIKITCPTRRIHNIWYNALKYLLDRSLENWINDDDLENQYEQDFSLDKKTEIERSQSQNFRKSQQSSLRKHSSIMNNRAPPKSSSVRSMSFYKSP